MEAPPVPTVAPVVPAATPAAAAIDALNTEEKRNARLARFGPAIISPPVPRRHKGPAVPERREEVKEEAAKAAHHGGHGGRVDKKAEARKAEVATLCSDADIAARTARWGKFAPSAAKTWLNTPLDLDLLAVKYKEERVDVPATATLRRNVLHVYGTDNIEAAPFSAHFAAFAPVVLQWINDSNCNVEFTSDAVAEEALNALTLPPKVVAGAEQHPNPWRLSNSKCGPNILLMRFATPADKKVRNPLSSALAPQSKIHKRQRVVSKNIKRALAAGGDAANEVLQSATSANQPNQEQMPSVPETAMTEAPASSNGT